MRSTLRKYHSRVAHVICIKRRVTRTGSSVKLRPRSRQWSTVRLTVSCMMYVLSSDGRCVRYMSCCPGCTVCHDICALAECRLSHRGKGGAGLMILLRIVRCLSLSCIYLLSSLIYLFIVSSFYLNNIHTAAFLPHLHNTLRTCIYDDEYWKNWALPSSNWAKCSATVPT